MSLGPFTLSQPSISCQVDLKSDARKMNCDFTGSFIDSFKDKLVHRRTHQLSSCWLKAVIDWHDFDGFSQAWFSLYKVCLLYTSDAADE